MVSVEQIKLLRQKTGLGVHDIKRALEEAKEDETKALELLKIWGLSTVSKRADRATAQGLIEAYVHQGRMGALVEVNCETDFVARNEDFRHFAHEVALQVVSMNPESVDELLKQEYFRDGALTVGDLLNQTIAKIGENIQISRFTRFELGL